MTCAKYKPAPFMHFKTPSRAKWHNFNDERFHHKGEGLTAGCGCVCMCAHVFVCACVCVCVCVCVQVSVTAMFTCEYTQIQSGRWASPRVALRMAVLLCMCVTLCLAVQVQ